MCLLCFVVLLFTLLGTCISIEEICQKDIDDDMAQHITCICNDNIKDFQIFEQFVYFSDAKYVTISKCTTVILETAEFYSSKLERLHLSHILIVDLTLFLPSSFTTLEIEDVRNLTSLSEQLFLHTQQLSKLVIKNTNVHLIYSHTFTDVQVNNVEFINTTFKHLTSNSMNFVRLTNWEQNSVFLIKNCVFEKLDTNAFSVRGMKNIQVIKTTVQGLFNKKTFNLPNTNTLFKSNSLNCGVQVETCNNVTLGIVENLHKLSNSNAQDLCTLLQTNFCNAPKTKSLIQSLKQCYPKLHKYGIHESCMPLQSDVSQDKGHSIHLNINLYMVCSLILKIVLL